MTLGNAHTLRGSVTISHGANIPGTSTQITTAAFVGAALGDTVLAAPAADPIDEVLVGIGPVVTTVDIIEIMVGNLSTATVAAGTAAVYNIMLLKASGEATT